MEQNYTVFSRLNYGVHCVQVSWSFDLFCFTVYFYFTPPKNVRYSDLIQQIL